MILWICYAPFSWSQPIRNTFPRTYSKKLCFLFRTFVPLDILSSPNGISVTSFCVTLSPSEVVLIRHFSHFENTLSFLI